MGPLSIKVDPQPRTTMFQTFTLTGLFFCFAHKLLSIQLTPRLQQFRGLPILYPRTKSRKVVVYISLTASIPIGLTGTTMDFLSVSGGSLDSLAIRCIPKGRVL